MIVSMPVQGPRRIEDTHANRSALASPIGPEDLQMQQALAAREQVTTALVDFIGARSVSFYKPVLVEAQRLAEFHGLRAEHFQGAVDAAIGKFAFDTNVVFLKRRHYLC